MEKKTSDTKKTSTKKLKKNASNTKKGANKKKLPKKSNSAASSSCSARIEKLAQPKPQMKSITEEQDLTPKVNIKLTAKTKINNPNEKENNSNYQKSISSNKRVDLN